MKTTFFLVFSEDGVEKMNKSKKPALKSGQRGVRMTVEIPDPYFESPFPEVAVEFDERDLIAPKVSARLEESKARFRDHFFESYAPLSEVRKDYVRDQIHTINHDLWSYFWKPAQSDPAEFALQDISRAVEIVVRQEQESPELPPEYRE